MVKVGLHVVFFARHCPPGQQRDTLSRLWYALCKNRMVLKKTTKRLPIKLSRSKIELFVQCPRCFYLDRKCKVPQPPGYPFNLNTAVDHLLKKEFDIHRARGEKHPLMKQYGIDAIPFTHDDLNRWRENFVGVRFVHEPTGILVTGAVDDIWVNPKGELHVVDYKATAKDSAVSIDADWQHGYKRQMEIYQWLLRQNKFSVSPTGYFVYCNGKRDKNAFDGRLEFDVVILPYEGSDAWVESTLADIAKCLASPALPRASATCAYCEYRKKARDVEPA